MPFEVRRADGYDEPLSQNARQVQSSSYSYNPQNALHRSCNIRSDHSAQTGTIRIAKTTGPPELSTKLIKLSHILILYMYYLIITGVFTDQTQF